MHDDALGGVVIGRKEKRPSKLSISLRPVGTGFSCPTSRHEAAITDYDK